MTAFSFLAEAFLNSPEVSSVLVADESLFICAGVWVCLCLYVYACGFICANPPIYRSSLVFVKQGAIISASLHSGSHNPSLDCLSL